MMTSCSLHDGGLGLLGEDLHGGCPGGEAGGARVRGVVVQLPQQLAVTCHRGASYNLHPLVSDDPPSVSRMVLRLSLAGYSAVSRQ